MPPLCALLHLLSTAHAEDAPAQAEPAAEPAPEQSVDTVLRPEVHTGAMYDGNVYRSEAEDAPTALAWTLSPRLALSTTDADRSFDLEVGYHLATFIDVAPADEAAIGNLNRFGDFDARLAGGIGQRRTVGLQVENVLEARSGSTELPTATGSANLRNVRDELTIALPIRFRSGLLATPDLHGDVLSYSVPDALFSQDDDARAHNFRGGFGSTWDIVRPITDRTALVAGSRLDIYFWRDHFVSVARSDAPAAPPYGDWIAKPDAMLARGTLGARHVVEGTFEAEARLGYALADYDEATAERAAAAAGADAAAEFTESAANGAAHASDLVDPSERLLADVHVAWTPLDALGLRLAYRKDVEDALISNYLTVQELSGAYHGELAGRLLVDAEAVWRVEGLRGEVSWDTSSLGVEGGVGWRVGASASIHADGGWRRQTCDGAACDALLLYTTRYTRPWGMLSARWAY